MVLRTNSLQIPAIILAQWIEMIGYILDVESPGMRKVLSVYLVTNTHI